MKFYLASAGGLDSDPSIFPVTSKKFHSEQNNFMEP